MYLTDKAKKILHELYEGGYNIKCSNDKICINGEEVQSPLEALFKEERRILVAGLRGVSLQVYNSLTVEEKTWASCYADNSPGWISPNSDKIEKFRVLKYSAAVKFAKTDQPTQHNVSKKFVEKVLREQEASVVSRMIENCEELERADEQDVTPVRSLR